MASTEAVPATVTVWASRAAQIVVGEAGVDAWGLLLQHGVDARLAGFAQPDWAAVFGEQGQHRGVGQIRPQRPFQGRMDAEQQVAHPVGLRGHLILEVVVVSDQHRQVGQRRTSDID